MRLPLITSALLAALALAPLDAAYYDLTKNTPQAQECVTFDVSYPYWTKGVYIATYPGHSRSKEGWIAPYYGGIVSNEGGKDQLIQFASWQMAGKNAPASGIDFIHAGPHMSWKRSNWEGSSGGIKGHWPNDKFKPGSWYRFFHRVWTPVDGPAHTGYAGIWMKSLDTGEWSHLATFKFPAELTGFDSMGGFTEYFLDNASNDCAVTFRNVYARRDGQWGSENEFTAYNHKEDSITLTPSEDKSAITLLTSRTPKNAGGRHTQVPVVNQKATLNQPETPEFFDKIEVTDTHAEQAGNRTVVRWKIDPKAAPQLGYRVELLAGDKVVATQHRRTPSTRLAVIDRPANAGTPTSVRLVIADIFGNDSAPVAIPLTAPKPLDALSATKAAAPGLSYRYFESDRGVDWMTLPDFDALTPKRTGVTATPDITPRLRRAGYGFSYTGDILIPRDGIYHFDAVAASGVRLTIDDKPVIDDPDYHSIAKSEGTVALRRGPHRFRIDYVQGPKQVQQSDDFLRLSWSGPGFERTPVPFSAFKRETKGESPRVTAKARVTGAGGIGLTLGADVSGLTGKIERVEYYGTAEDYDYFGGQDARGGDFLLAVGEAPDKPVEAVIWGGKNRRIRARVVTHDGRTFDSAPVTLADAPAPEKLTRGPRPFTLTPLEHHLYPAAFSIDGGTVTLVGESMNLLTTPLVGDGTITARLVEMTDGKPQADGTTPQDAANWFGGIILRNNLDPRPGKPLGGADIPFTTVVGAANQATRHCDSTMIDGAGNQPSGNVGGADYPWYRIERRGTTFTSLISKDGKEWKKIKTVELPKATDTMQAGFVLYSIPNATPRVHRAKFDNITLGK